MPCGYAAVRCASAAVGKEGTGWCWAGGKVLLCRQIPVAALVLSHGSMVFGPVHVLYLLSA